MTTKHQLRSEVKSTGTAYLCYFLFGAHFAYLRRWDLQILFWVTIYGLGIWGFIELFLVGKRVRSHNEIIFKRLASIEKAEKEEDFKKQMELMKAMKEA